MKCHCCCCCCFVVYLYIILSTIINTSHLVKMQRHTTIIPRKQQNFSLTTQALLFYTHVSIYNTHGIFKAPPHSGLVWDYDGVFLFTFLDDVVWYAAVYIYVINFIFHFSLESGIMQILNAILYVGVYVK